MKLTCIFTALCACFAFTPMAAYAKPKTGGMSKTEIRSYEKQKKKEESDRKKALKNMRKKAVEVEKSMAKVTPIPRPDVQVEESELDALKAAAEKGEAAALIRLGHYYMMHPVEGFGNEREAGECFRKAAESGDADGAAWLALYTYITTPINGSNWKEVADKCHEDSLKAAEQGSMIGEYLVGLTASEREEKLQWYEKAARKGFVPAMRGVGLTLIDIAARTPGMYNYSVTPEAQAWLKLAGANGDAEAYRALCTEGANFSGSPSERPPVDFAKLEGYARKQLELARNMPWVWYDTAFDTRILIDRYSHGGIASISLINAWGSLVSLAKRQGKDLAPVFRQMANELTKAAKEGNTNAMAAIVHSARNWDKLFFPTALYNTPCPYDPAPWQQALQEKANSGDLHIRRQLQ